MFGKNSATIIILGIFVVLELGLVNTVHAASITKDSDLDGISDTAETRIYNTDPLNADTDGDGVIDSREIIDQTNPLDKNSSKISSLDKSAATLFDKSDPLVWYAARISGILSFVLFSIVVSFGLLMSSKSLLKIKIVSSPNAFETHKTIALLALLLVCVHISTFFFDDILRLSVREALLPFQVIRNFNSIMGYSFYLTVSLGVLAFYLGILIVFTSYFRNKIVNNKTWRIIHYSTFLFYVLFLVHGFTAGSDSKEPWMRAIYITSFSIFIVLTLLRIFGKKYFMTPKIVKNPTVNTLAATPTESTQIIKTI